MQSMYDREQVKFMWQELEQVGLKPLFTPQEVDTVIKEGKGTTLVMVNSVCGCSAGYARPGVALALQNKVIPDNLTTVFAGVDMEATQRARELMTDMPPSSPSVALFKDGELVFMLHRRQIEGSSAEMVAEALVEAFNEHCSKSGPSVSKEVFMKVYGEGWGPVCGSQFER